MKKDIYKKCCLCPSREGALKPTDTGGWAHVVCALYIQEVSFGDMNSLEPIIVTNVPKERFKQTCSICTERQQNHLAGQGACMSCARVGCKSAFHVTCAQEKGFLFEELVNNNNNSLCPQQSVSNNSGQQQTNGENMETHAANVNYRGYCAVHITKLRNSGRLKRSGLSSQRSQKSVSGSGGTEVQRPIAIPPTASSSTNTPLLVNAKSVNSAPLANAASFEDSFVRGRTHPNPLLSDPISPIASLTPNVFTRKVLNQNSPTSPISAIERSSQLAQFSPRSPPVAPGTLLSNSGNKLNLEALQNQFSMAAAAASTSIYANGTDFVKASPENKQLTSQINHIANLNKKTNTTSSVAPNGYNIKLNSNSLSNGDLSTLAAAAAAHQTQRVPKNGVSYIQTSTNNGTQYNTYDTYSNANSSYESLNPKNNAVNEKTAAKPSGNVNSLKRADKTGAAGSGGGKKGAETTSLAGSNSAPPPMKKPRVKTARRSTGSNASIATAPETLSATSETALPGGRRTKSSHSVSCGSPLLGSNPGTTNLSSPRLLGLNSSGNAASSTMSSPGTIHHQSSLGSQLSGGVEMSQFSPLLLDSFQETRKQRGSVSSGLATQQMSMSSAELDQVKLSSSGPLSHTTFIPCCSAAAVDSRADRDSKLLSSTSSTSSGGATTSGGHSLTSMVSLLEEQWSQGSQFLMLQGKKYNIPSLLSSLYELQTENRQLENELTDITSKRKQLHLMNQQLALPLSSTNSNAPAHPSTQISGHHASNLTVGSDLASNCGTQAVIGSLRVPSRSKSYSSGGLQSNGGAPLAVVHASEGPSYYPNSNSVSETSSVTSNGVSLFESTAVASNARLNGPSALGGSTNHTGSSSSSNRRTPTTPLHSPISAATFSGIASGSQQLISSHQDLNSSAENSSQNHYSSSSSSALLVSPSNASVSGRLSAALASRTTPNSTSAVTASIVQQQQQQHHQQQQQIAAQIAAAAAQVSYIDPSTYSLLAQQQLVASYHRALAQTTPQQTQATNSPVVDQIAQSYRLAAAAAASGLDGSTPVLLNPAMLNTLFTSGPSAPR